MADTEYLALSKDEDTFITAEAIEDGTLGDKEARALAIRANSNIVINKLSDKGLLNAYTYSFKQGSKRIIGLGVKGVDACCNWIGNIRVRLIEHAEDDESYTCIFEAEDLVCGTNAYAQVKEPKYTPDGKPNNFAERKCFSKAQRNAKLKVIPTEILVQVAERFDSIQEGHEKEVAYIGIADTCKKNNISEQQLKDYVSWKFNKSLEGLELSELKLLKSFVTLPIGDKWFKEIYPQLIEMNELAEAKGKLKEVHAYLVKKYKTLADVPQDVIKDSISKLR